MTPTPPTPYQQPYQQPYPMPVRLDSGLHKSAGTAYLLWFFLGFLGIHRFYLRQTGTGVLYALTGGLFFIGWFVDAFLIPGITRRVNLYGH